MALDPLLLARACAPATFVDARDEVRKCGSCVVFSANGDGLMLLPAARQSMFASGAQGPVLAVTDMYGLLGSLGLVAAAGRSQGDSIHLTGGSVSSCDLVTLGGHAVVHKTVTRSQLPVVDSIERHRGEADWIVALQADGCDHLFPRTRIIRDDDTAFVVESEFVGCYTLGEWFLQEHLRGKSGFEEAVIREVFGILRGELYSRDRSGGARMESYLDKMRRRLRLVLSDSTIQPIARLMFEDGAIIDNSRCRPLSEQLRALESARFDDLLKPAQLYECHGDLIPEDILVDGTGSVVAFVDPNPQNADPLVDLAKCVMSCCTRYDLALRDWLEVEVRQGGHGQLLAISTSWLREWRPFASRQETLGLELAKHAAEYMPPWITSTGRVTLENVLVLAGLQAICIVPFHLIHHDRPSRALHFLAAGQLLIERALLACGL